MDLVYLGLTVGFFAVSLLLNLLLVYWLLFLPR